VLKTIRLARRSQERIIRRVAKNIPLHYRGQMDLFPAIDLRDGKCVRLLQGDYNRQIDYGDDPVAQAQEFEQRPCAIAG